MTMIEWLFWAAYWLGFVASLLHFYGEEAADEQEYHWAWGLAVLWPVLMLYAMAISISKAGHRILLWLSRRLDINLF